MQPTFCSCLLGGDRGLGSQRKHCVNYERGTVLAPFNTDRISSEKHSSSFTKKSGGTNVTIFAQISNFLGKYLLSIEMSHLQW